MCSNCDPTHECNCAGGTVFVQCQCEKGVHCPICDHRAATNLATDPDLVMEICSPALVAEFVRGGKQVVPGPTREARAA